MASFDNNQHSLKDYGPAAPDAKVTSTAQNDANAVVESLRHDGNEKAYDKLLHKVGDAKQHLQPTQLHQYSAEIANDLEKAGVLPQFSLAWAEHALAAGKLDIDHKRVISDAELRSYGKDKVDPLTRRFAEAAEERLKPTMEKNNGTWFSSSSLRDAVSTSQLHELVSEDSKLTKDEQTTALARANANYLTTKAKDLGGKSLLELAAQAGGGNVSEVGEQDFHALLANSLAGLPRHDKDFLTNMMHNWNNPEFKKMRTSGPLSSDSITPDSLKTLNSEREDRVAAQNDSHKTIKPDTELQESAKKLLAPIPTLGNISLFRAAELAAVHGNESTAGKTVGKYEIQALLNDPLVKSLNKLEPENRKFLEDMVTHFDKYRGLLDDRHGNQITEESLKEAASQGLTLDQKKNQSEDQEKEKALNHKADEALTLRNLVKENASYLLTHKYEGKDLITAAIAAGESAKNSAGKDDFQKLLANPLATLDADDAQFIGWLVQNWNSDQVEALKEEGGRISVESAKRFQNAS